MATNNTTATNKAKVETFEVSWQARKSDGKPFMMVKLWANGRQTHTVLMGDDKAHLAAILSGMAAAVNAFAEPMPAAKVKAAAPAVAAAPAAAPDLAAIMAEIQRLSAENARLAAGQSAAPVVAAAPVATSTQARLSRIKARAK